MIAVAKARPTATERTQIATFYVDQMLLGIELEQVQEIHRLLDVTPVPYAPPFVRGVINLRGDVVTVIDLRQLLDLPAGQVTPKSRNVIIHLDDERIGLIVDQVADILTIDPNDISPPPANVGGVEGRYFSGVYMLECELVVLLDVATALATDKPR